MNTIVFRLGTGITTCGIAAGLFVPKAFATSVHIAGNGAHSHSSVQISDTSKTTIEQSNESRVSNTVVVSQNTGGNSIEGTTGGEATISTGDAVSGVVIANHGNTNYLSFPCGCEASDTHVGVLGNGAHSHTDVVIEKHKELSLSQANESDSDTVVVTEQNTGNNTVSGSTNWESRNSDWEEWWSWDRDDWDNWWDAEDNSHASITTGDALAFVEVHNMGSKNIIK